MPKIVDEEKINQEIIKKSFSLFMKSGYKTVSMRDIAAECGVTTGVLYHYFKNKDALVEAILLRQLSHEQNIRSEDNSHILKDLFENEEASRTTVLLLIDLCRSKDTKLMNKGQELGTAFLSPSSSTTKMSVSQKLKRFYLTYAVGILITRLWSQKQTSVNDYIDSLKEYAKQNQKK